jgi:hypothetical protein
MLIATFHPELTSDTTVHNYFVRMAGGEISVSEDPVLGLAGSGKQLWSTERGDEYVQRLREKTE